MTANDAAEKRSSVGEAGCVVVLLLIGAALRLAYPERIAVEHFDEGVYACDAMFPGGYPFRHLYAPPLMPLAIQYTSAIGFAETFGPAIPNLAASCLTLVVIWWLARNWFGCRAGIATLTAASLSQLHVAFSRTALTDAMLLCWLVCSLYYIERLLRRSDPWSIVGLGLTTNFAWWTKYNGWLPLAIALGGIGLCAVQRGTRQDVKRQACAWGIATAMASALWLPVWWSLPNGYGEVAANHQKYLVGFSGWPRSFFWQLGNLILFDGYVPMVMLALGVVGLAKMTWRVWRSKSLSQVAPLAVVTVGFAGLFIATPLYTPYARLLLPWSAMTWLAFGLYFSEAGFMGYVGLTMSSSGDRSPQSPTMQRPPAMRRLAMVFGVLAVVCVAGCFVWQVVSRGWRPWEDRRSLAGVAEALLRDERSQRKSDPQQDLEDGANESRTIFAVYGEPALVYQLTVRGGLAVPFGSAQQAVEGRLAQSRTRFVLGPHAAQDRRFMASWEQASRRFNAPKQYSTVRSLLGRLDQAQFPADADRRGEFEAFRLYGSD